jgi:hypothetical protein
MPIGSAIGISGNAPIAMCFVLNRGNWDGLVAYPLPREKAEMAHFA